MTQESQIKLALDNQSKAIYFNSFNYIVESKTF